MPQLTTSDGIRLHYEDIGSGRPIVFSAGWAMDGSWWRHQLGFASTHRLLIFDPRSQGESEKVVRGLRMGRQAADLRELLDTLDLEDVTVVAHSRSTSICLAYWELFGSHRLGRLVLIGVTPSISKKDDWEWGFMMDPVAFQSLILADHEGVVRQVIADLMLTPPPTDEVEQMVRNMMLTPPMAGARMLEDHGVIDWRDMLETISIPVLVCVGRFDRNAPLPAAEHVAEAVAKGRLVVFENSAHVPFYEEPAEFNRILKEFLGEGT